MLECLNEGMFECLNEGMLEYSLQVIKLFICLSGVFKIVYQEDSASP